MGKHFVYRNSRPSLAIEGTGGRSLGRCYSESTYRVTSTQRLSRDQLVALNRAGFLGCGQEFGISSPCDGKEAPAGEDEIPCIVVDEYSGKVLDEPAINPYSGKPYGSHKSPYFVYECYSRCDSGD